MTIDDTPRLAGRCGLFAVIAAAFLAASPAPAFAQAQPADASPPSDALPANGPDSVDLVAAALARIAEIDDAGPRLNAVIATYPDAMEQARARDVERAASVVTGPLHGLPILLKDNIEAAGPLPTTAGSLALADNVTGRDAPLVARLRSAGAVILGRTNLSEWANFRDGDSTSGWSAVGGLTRNPHSLDRSACGSSSGSGAAIAAGMAFAAIGTETDGSITCPASMNGIVGFKPTVGLVSRRFIVPISDSQDTAGPMARTVRDAALVLSAIAGTDPGDARTAEADSRRRNYVAWLRPDALRGLRVGVMRPATAPAPALAALYDRALAVLVAQGATLVEIGDPGVDRAALGQAEFTVLLAEFRDGMNAYLAGLPAGAPMRGRTLDDLIVFNAATPAETRWFGQDIFEGAAAAPAIDSDAYRSARDNARRLAGEQGIDRLLRDHGVDILVAITNGPAWAIDLINGDNFSGPSASALPAVAGYPHLTVPMGALEGMPVGLSFIGTAWDDARILAAGYAYEQASHARVEPTFRPYVAP